MGRHGGRPSQGSVEGSPYRSRCPAGLQRQMLENRPSSSIAELGVASRPSTSIQERRGLFWVRHEQISGLSAFAARSAVAKVEAARWGLGRYGRFRTWCEAYPSTSMAPTSCGWVLGGSCSGFLALCRS